LSNRYLVRPKADEDLDEQAYYYASKATPELGHRFLMAARDFQSSRHTIGNGMASPAETSRPDVAASLSFKNIIILYLPVAESVEILRVISGSRSLEALLSREGLE
jgi:plasmid stabilization system protein ParE